MTSCPTCDRALVTVTESEMVDYRGGAGKLEHVRAEQVPYLVCPSCGGRFVFAATLYARQEAVDRVTGVRHSRPPTHTENL